jgi:hypothetical protein
MNARVLRVLTVTVLLITSGPAIAQTTSPEEQDIMKALAAISGPDPIQRVLAAETSLKSDDHLLRSLALEKALESSDSRVKEVALTYLVTTQKQLIATLNITSDNLSGVDNPGLKETLLGLSLATIKFNKFDANTLTLTAYVNNWYVVGAVNQSGLTMVLTFATPNCQLQFRGVSGGALRGALTCGTLSFAASTPLP